MNNEVAKIIGDNLESNGTMVLFGDYEIGLSPDSETEFSGTTIITEYDTITEASRMTEAIYAYLDECAKTHSVVFRPKISLTEELSVSVPIMHMQGEFSATTFARLADTQMRINVHLVQDTNAIVLSALVEIIS